MAHPIYKVNGTRVPSVTTILGMYGEKEGLLAWANKLGLDGKSHREERDQAGGVGTIVHEMVEAHIQDRKPKQFAIDELACGGDEERYAAMFKSAGQSFLAYLAWREMARVDVVCTECSLVSEDFMFGGTPDAIAETPLGLALLDWKSSSRLHHTYVAQVAAYCHLWRKGAPLSGDVPARFGETIATAHLLRFDKTHGTFTHAHLNRNVIVKGWKLFDALRQAYVMDHELKGAV